MAEQDDTGFVRLSTITDALRDNLPGLLEGTGLSEEQAEQVAEGIARNVEGGAIIGDALSETLDAAVDVDD